MTRQNIHRMSINGAIACTVSSLLGAIATLVVGPVGLIWVIASGFGVVINLIVAAYNE